MQEDESTLPPMTAQDYSEINDWPGYFAAVIGKGPRGTLVSALDGFAREGLADGLAVDLAAGEGRDTLELLTRGWRVVATDSHPEAFSYLWPRVPEALRPRLSTQGTTFSETQIPSCDLVNASYALPFCEPCHFEALWSKIESRLPKNCPANRPPGRIAATWASLPGRTHHSRDEVLTLLEGFTIEMMGEEESDDTPDVRNPKHWQLFHVVARKC